MSKDNRKLKTEFVGGDIEPVTIPDVFFLARIQNQASSGSLEDGTKARIKNFVLFVKSWLKRGRNFEKRERFVLAQLADGNYYLVPLHVYNAYNELCLNNYEKMEDYAKGHHR